MASLVSFRTGRLEPSVAYLTERLRRYLTERLRRSRDAVVRALAALQAHGFLDRLRRYEPTGREGRGPQVRQVSNAYRLIMPPRALRLLGIQGQPAPLPDDVAHAQEVQRLERDAYRTILPLDELVDELATHEVTDTTLGGLLAQLGRHLTERESATQEESQARISK